MSSATTKDRAMDMEIQQVPWWNRRTRMERRFFILSIILLLATVGLSIALAGVLYKDIISQNADNKGNYGSARVAAARSNADVLNNLQTTSSFSSSEHEHQSQLRVVENSGRQVALGAGRRVKDNKTVVTRYYITLS